MYQLPFPSPYAQPDGSVPLRFGVSDLLPELCAACLFCWLPWTAPGHVLRKTNHFNVAARIVEGFPPPPPEQNCWLEQCRTGGASGWAGSGPGWL